MFFVIDSAVSLIFLSRFESVETILLSRSIAIYSRSDSISPSSLMLSRSLLSLSRTLRS